ERKRKYIFSAIGIIDLISIIPTYLSIFLVGYQFLLVFRSLRLLRVFKILQLKNFQHAGNYISSALHNSYRKILIFMMFISLMVVIIGSVMYIVEKDTPGFESIPHAVYWAVVTITTVGYGDVSPMTSMGKFLSMIVMLCGYSIIAVPTGIVTMEMARGRDLMSHSDKSCNRCGMEKQRGDARYCYKCGEKLVE
ncbi:MAG: ion transporter, partial [Ginsengibacter sp.]